MDEINAEDAIQQCLDSVFADKLCLVCGAGLSMAPPSSLPSAATVAARAKEEYESTIGLGRAPLSDEIEKQAEFFFQRDELASIYFGKLVDLHAFAGPPNLGHVATADLLLVKAFQSAVSTNVDTLVEVAGNHLFGQVGVCLDGHGAATIAPGGAPYLKIHGCRQADPNNMVWAPGQLCELPVKTRIEQSEVWLKAQLLNKDLLIVGFWTDWDYLLGVLESTLGEVSASKVFVIDPAASDTLRAKAPDLYSLVEHASTSFIHVQTSASAFLNELRVEFSRKFIAQALHRGKAEYEAATGQATNPNWLELNIKNVDQLWSIRRDIEGCNPNVPATLLNPPNESLYGATILQLRAAGATLDHSHWLLCGKRIRVIRAANQSLAKVQADHAREESQLTAPSVVIAVGAESYGLASSIARTETSPSVTRGSKSEWMTRPQAIEELHL